MFQIRDHQAGRILFVVKGSAFLFHLGLKLIDEAHPHMGTIFFAQFYNLSVNVVQKHYYRSNQNNI